MWRQRTRRQRHATSGAVTTAGDSGRQRPRVAPSADRNVSGPRRLRGVTSASRNVERRYVSERRDVSEPQRQRTATTAWRDVSEPQRQAARRQRATSSAQHQARNIKRATWARRYVRAPKRQRGAKLVYAVVGEEQGRSRETTVPGTDSSKYKSIYLGIRGSLWADPRNFWSSTTTGLLALRVTNSQL